jgi:hypothetical protein
MTFKRWLPTFLAFPAGGLLAETVGGVHGPLSAAASGLLAGAVIGAGQWLALRSDGVGPRWIAHTAAAMAPGSAVAAAVTGAGTEMADLVATGLIAGAAVGAAQAPLLPAGRLVHAVGTAAAWAAGWATTTAVGVDVERGYAVFGSTGALIATVLTGLVVRRAVAGGRRRSAGTAVAIAEGAA